ncbi:hypothetical protein [Clostridium neonatale]|jgi:hypothetical protein|uniref:hypothetical protein n=1 Tax=Clostridium neonatale TaxID=137838 RepID=UPI00291BBF79|nr:hypothetical protein [Clostridium neonatale]CAI3207593.1 hypothetical protein CNEO2_360011 [Clostridium neonatale]
MNIKKLDDSELVKIYKKARAKFSLAKEGTEEEREAESLYDTCYMEVSKRKIDLRKY